MAASPLEGLKLAEYSDVKNAAMSKRMSNLSTAEQVLDTSTSTTTTNCSCGNVDRKPMATACSGNCHQRINSGAADSDSNVKIGGGHSDAAFLSVKFDRLSVVDTAESIASCSISSTHRPRHVTISGAKHNASSSGKVLAIGKSAKSRVEKKRGKVFGDSFAGSLESFAKLSLSKGVKTAITADDGIVATPSTAGKGGRLRTAVVRSSEDEAQLEKEVEEEGDEDTEEFGQSSTLHLNMKCNGKRKRSTSPPHQLVEVVSCGQQVRLINDINPDDLAGYLEDTTFFPKKMSYMAEMMYT